ncbi:tetratricopeptide repeat protein [Massilia sp. LjRoot122]|uniref:LytR C-terminal domain-containing protein n=1 Tax=Massilia sp. LjRoot122 TaxID=3342257 RepID=UPI003ECDB711
MRTPTVLALLAVTLLPACRNVPAPLQALFHPAQQVRHGGNDAASSYYRLGRYHQERGELEQAMTAYNYATARDPRAPLPRMAAAVIHAQQGRLAQARAMLLAVCADHPALVQPLNNLGYVYYLQGDYAAAADAFRAVLALQPGNERALNNLQLAEGGGQRGAAPTAVLAATPQPAPAPASAPAATEPAAGGLRLVQSAPNVYELRQVQAAPPSPELAPAARKDLRLEIANGNGATGLAKRFRDALATQGHRATRLTNAKPFGQPKTRIEFRPGFETEAQGLRLALGGKAVLAPAAPQAAADLRLLLGKDAALAPAPALLTAATNK